MGYESKIYFCRKHLISAFERDYFSSEIIAMIDMRKMGYDDEVMKFRKLFNKDTDFGIYIPSSDEEGNEIACYEIEDMYGEHIKYGNIKELINQLKEVIKKDDYWRFKLLLSMLEMFKDVPDIYVVHYGY